MSWQIINGVLPLDRALIMGILNVTPDSFSDGGFFYAPDSALAHAQEMTTQGANIIDVGAQSTRPGSLRLDEQEEWGRLEPVLARLCQKNLPPISVDTYHPNCAHRALAVGAAIINDVRGFADSRMRSLAAASGCGCVIMHSENIENISEPAAEDNFGGKLPACVLAVRAFFERRVAQCLSDGIRPAQIVLDPGIGFGKTREQDRALILHAGACSAYGLPVMIAASRKRVIATFWSGDVPPEKRDEGTHAAHLAAVRSGAVIVRVHDVSGAVRSLR